MCIAEQIINSMKKLILLGALLACFPSKASQFKMEILVDGKPLTKFSHNDKQFIQGVKDSEFAIHFENGSAGRVLVVPSVDGLSAMDGKKANPESGGYVVNAGDKLDLTGWRVSLEQVKKFVFATKESGETYSEKTTGSTENCGVISLKVVPEKILPPPIQWNLLNDSSIVPCSTLTTVNLNVSATSGNLTAASGFDLGTKMGDEAKSVVHEISFDRGPTSEDLTVYYASLNGLRDLGVDMNIYPEAFASTSTENKFCKVP